MVVGQDENLRYVLSVCLVDPQEFLIWQFYDNKVKLAGGDGVKFLLACLFKDGVTHCSGRFSAVFKFVNCINFLLRCQVYLTSVYMALVTVQELGRGYLNAGAHAVNFDFPFPLVDQNGHLC